MALYAYGRIVHGEEDGTMVEFNAGDEIKSSDLPKEVIEQCIERGLIVRWNPLEEEPTASDELETQEKLDAAEARIAELEEQLAAKEKAPAGSAKSS